MTKAVNLLSLLPPGQFLQVTAVSVLCILSPKGRFCPFKEVFGA